MKKIINILGLALLVASCSEDYDDWAAPQTNPQEEVKTVTLATAAAADVEFASLDSALVQLFVPTVTAEDDQTTSYKVTLWNADATASQTIDADANGYASADDVKNAVETLYGKRPEMRTVTMDIVGYTIVNGQSIKNTSTGSINITLTAPVIESAYYLVGVLNGWTLGDTSLKFNHSGKDVYEDPIFTLAIAAPCDEEGQRIENKFKIAPQSSIDDPSTWDGVIGGDSEDMTKLVVGGAGVDFVQPADDGAKMYKITLNMMDYTITIEALSFEEWAWTPGDQNGWSHGAAARMQSPAFDGVYTGYAYLNGGFKLTSQADWNGTNYGWATETTLSTDGGAGNLWAEEGFYAVNIDCANLTWAVTPMSWGVIGDATAGGWDVDTDMTYDTAEKCLVATLDLTGGKSFKFRANDDWAVNYGGDISNLSAGGDNIPVAEDGNYTIKLYLERITSDQFYCTITKN